MSDLTELLQATAVRASDYRRRVGELPVFPDDLDGAELRTRLGSLPDGPTSPAAVVNDLIEAVEPALVSSTGPRYFGFVTGGALEAATAADMMTVAWDQLAFNPASSPAAAVVEEVVGEWLKALLGLPSTASFGLTIGGQGANTIALAAARHAVLAGSGWDVERRGLSGAPTIRVVANGERHATIDRSLRLLGLGTDAIEPVATDDQGRVDVTELDHVLASKPPGPTIVCLQAGNVNSGAVDDFDTAVAASHRHGAWVHVDGAFGLWAAASPTTAALVAGVEGADSWSVDGHKWLNVPYDAGFVFCADASAHQAAMSFSAAYLTQAPGEARNPTDYVPESSRRARSFATYAALRQLGRSGMAELVERCCALARRFAEQLAGVDGVTVGNDVALNQVLVRFADDDAVTDAVIEEVQRSGVCWMGGTTWQGGRHMRISVSSAQTTEADVDRSVAAIVEALQRAG